MMKSREIEFGGRLGNKGAGIDWAMEMPVMSYPSNFHGAGHIRDACWAMTKKSNKQPPVKGLSSGRVRGGG